MPSQYMQELIDDLNRRAVRGGGRSDDVTLFIRAAAAIATLAQQLDDSSERVRAIRYATALSADDVAALVARYRGAKSRTANGNDPEVTP